MGVEHFSHYAKLLMEMKMDVSYFFFSLYILLYFEVFVNEFYFFYQAFATDLDGQKRGISKCFCINTILPLSSLCH